MRNERRTVVPQYKAPVGNAPAKAPISPAMALPTPDDESHARKPRTPQKRRQKPSGESAGSDDATVSTRLSRALLAKLDRLRARTQGPHATRSAVLRWLLDQYPE